MYVCITLVLETPSGGSQMGLQKEREEEKDISGVKYLFYTTGSSGQAVEIGFLDLAVNRRFEDSNHIRNTISWAAG